MMPFQLEDNMNRLLGRIRLLDVSVLIIMLFATANYATAQSQQPPINVDVFYPNPIQSNINIILTGTVEAKQRAQLAPLEAGRVKQLEVEIGDIVTKGQTLLSLDSKLAELEVLAAKASLMAIQVNLNEANRLYQEVLLLSKQQLVAQTLISERAALLANSEAQLANSQATLSLRHELLNRHTLQAPFAGVIAQRNVDLGEWITQQTPILTLVAQDDLRLTISIPQQYYSRLAKQLNVSVKVVPDSVDAQSFSAVLNRLVPVSDPITRTFMAQIDLPKETDLVAGMSARAQISLPNTSQKTFMLPRSAIKQHPDGGSSVFIVKNGMAKRIITSYVQMSGNLVEISDHPVDLPYIVTGVELLKDGTPVTANTVASIR
ncbi:MAG: RND family efflux transporter MFP subunit [Flavobacteriales bacterium]|jgi:RND family efflux transporter MFP subunit